MKKMIFAFAALAASMAIAAMNYVQPSGSAMLTATADTAAGDIVTVGSSDLVGIAMNAAASNGTFVAYTAGVFAFSNATTNAIDVGATVYRNSENANAVDTTSTNSVKVGICLGTAANGAVLVDINR